MQGDNLHAIIGGGLAPDTWSLTSPEAGILVGQVLDKNGKPVDDDVLPVAGPAPVVHSARPTASRVGEFEKFHRRQVDSVVARARFIDSRQQLATLN